MAVNPISHMQIAFGIQINHITDIIGHVLNNEIKVLCLLGHTFEEHGLDCGCLAVRTNATVK